QAVREHPVPELLGGHLPRVGVACGLEVEEGGDPDDERDEGEPVPDLPAPPHPATALAGEPEHEARDERAGDDHAELVADVRRDEAGGDGGNDPADAG